MKTLGKKSASDHRFGVAVVFSALMILLASNQAHAQSSITISAGLATPNDQIADVYNTNRVSDGKKDIWGLIHESSNIGYDLSARLRYPLGESFQFDAGIGFSRFPKTPLSVVDTATGQSVVTLTSVQNIIPISVGLDYVVFHSLISPYISGELQYNYISSTVDYPTGGPSIPLNLDTAPVDSRVGAAFGAGMMFNFALVAVNLDVRYHMANLIGKTGLEKEKNYLTLNAGVTFGWK